MYVASFGPAHVLLLDVVQHMEAADKEGSCIFSVCSEVQHACRARMPSAAAPSGMRGATLDSRIFVKAEAPCGSRCVVTGKRLSKKRPSAPHCWSRVMSCSQFQRGRTRLSFHPQLFLFKELCLFLVNAFSMGLWSSQPQSFVLRFLFSQVDRGSNRKHTDKRNCVKCTCFTKTR